MAMLARLTESRVREALSSVHDPQSGQTLVTAGMIQAISIDSGEVQVLIEVDPARGQELEPLRQQAETAVSGLRGVRKATAILTAERPAGSAPQADAPGPQQPAQPAQSQQGKQPGHAQQASQGRQAQQGTQAGKRELAPGVKKIVAVASGKGGVGKSTLAINLSLPRQPHVHATGLLDADIYGPSLPRLTGLVDKKPDQDEAGIQPHEMGGCKLMSIGFMIEESRPMIWRGPIVQSALQQMLRDVAWGELDILVVDMPPGTGDAQLTMAQQVPLAGAVICSTPQDLALSDARKGLAMFEKVDVPVLGIVENMSYFLCPSCGERAEIFGHGGARQTAAELGAGFLGEIPLHTAIRETSDAGTPIVLADPDGGHARAFHQVAARVAEGLFSEQAGKPAPSIVIE